MPVRGVISAGWKPWVATWKAVVAEQASASQQRLDEILSTINTIQQNQPAALKSTATPTPTEPKNAPLASDTPSTSTTIQQTANIATPASTPSNPSAEPPVETPSYSRLRQLVASVLPFAGSVGSAVVKSIPTPHAIKPAPAVVPTKAERIALARRIASNRAAAELHALALLKKLQEANTSEQRVEQLQALYAHLMQYPTAKAECVNANCESLFLCLRQQAQDDNERSLCNICLALVGYTRPPGGRGLRILSIDGGGTRGMMSLEILAALESHLPPGKRLHDVFDMMVGVSTGAIMCALLGAFRLTVPECKRIYRELSSRLFTRARLSGVSGLIWQHSYYDSTFWVQLLKRTVGEKSMMELVRRDVDGRMPKLAFVSCIVNSTKLEPFMFRNYAIPVGGRQSIYAGSCKYTVWQALQASAAAPGYFEEVSLDSLVHQDGGVLVNNPTAVAVHEARALWPSEQLQCVLSIGNGRSMNTAPLLFDAAGLSAPATAAAAAATTSLTDKIVKIVDSATDTELVHSSLSSLIDSRTYYRLNPYMTQMYSLDEIAPDRLDQMQIDAQMYIRRNTPKIKAVAETLCQERTARQRIVDKARHESLTRFAYKLR